MQVQGLLDNIPIKWLLSKSLHGVHVDDRMPQQPVCHRATKFRTPIRECWENTVVKSKETRPLMKEMNVRLYDLRNVQLVPHTKIPL